MICRMNTVQENEITHMHKTHGKLVPECSAPQRGIERTQYKMTKWLKCRNITPDNKNGKHRRHTSTQCLTKATHPRQQCTQDNTVQGSNSASTHHVPAPTHGTTIHKPHIYTPPNTAKEHEDGPTRYVPNTIYLGCV